MERYYLTYDLGMWDDEIICETFDTFEEMLARFEEIMWEVGTIDGWEIRPDGEADKKVL